ncbi:MAG TPA: crossover junction endodeoxyribonuclease RuvC [Acidimicrobiales bacterium]|nr:crossover junction endodeoxyribonuclease RuvC [Acidimicrobiales bacterium]
MFVVGIDPGVSRCGYGAVRQEGGQPVAVVSGVLTTLVSRPLEQRLGELLKELRELFCRLSPEVVVVERVLFQANARTAMAVGQASGLALAAAAEIGVPVVQYSPNEVKQAVTGWGNAGKDQVQRMVQALLDLPDKPSPPDRADALALALCHLALAPLAKAVAVADARGSGTVGRSGVGRGAVAVGAVAGRRH